MKIAVLKDPSKKDPRVSLIPSIAEKMVKAGDQIFIEKNFGEAVSIPDEDYEKAGVTLADSQESFLGDAEVLLSLAKPEEEDLNKLSSGSIWISFLDPFSNRPLIEKFCEKGITAISMEMIPRTTRAQKMDALSSQANLGGYNAVIAAANDLDKVFPMMMTAAGTIMPAKVFVIGVGVAGLQAIATAKRLGAKVEAFDTRPVVEEQVKSLGAKFVKIDLGETGQTQQGYAKELTPEQLEKQRQGMLKACKNADIVITTAQLFGRKAPVIVNAEMVAAMTPGSIIVDMAVGTGGNVEGSVPDETVEVNGVKIIGITNLPGKTPLHASQVYASNLYNLIEEFRNKEEKKLVIDLEDEILKGCVITHENKIVNSMIQNFYENQK